MAFSVADSARFFGWSRRGADRPAGRFTRTAPDQALAAEVYSDLAAEFPDEDLLEDIDDCIELYRPGSKPRCEEAEYLRILLDARARLGRGH